MSNFFRDFIDSLFGTDDPEKIKKRTLKNIAKDLSKTKYKFYKHSTNEVEASLGKFFYEIYKIISPAQAMFQTSTPNTLKAIVLDYSLSEAQKKLIDEISPDNLSEFAKGKSPDQIAEKINSTEQEFVASMNNDQLEKIDSLYTKLIYLKNFCTYDFYFILKKFDPHLREHDFTTQPSFRNINGTYIAEDLKNFISVAWVLQFDEDWTDVFKSLRMAKGVEPITLPNWKKAMARMKNVKDKKVLEMVIKLITENPGYEEHFNQTEYYVIDEYITSVRKAAQEFLDKVKSQLSEGKINELLVQIFGSTSISTLKNYTAVNSSIYERKGVGSFLFTGALNYLKCFLLNYTKRELRELSDILLVRAEWTNHQLATPMSEAFHKILELSERITALDTKLAESNEYGTKLKTYIPRADRDKEANNIIKMLLNDINEEARECIKQAIQYFATYGRNLKMLLEDFVRVKPEIVLNWKDINHFAENRLKDMCVDAYKKLYYMVNLLQQFKIEKSIEDEVPEEE